MLLKLSIKNYILIQSLEVDFTQGLSVITGETGAGKSIFLGALGLILGQRIDTSVLLDKSKKCYVEGIFNIKGYHMEDYFQQHELDFEEEIILRREINQGGKSRAFINDTPVSLSELKNMGDQLVNIHSQHSIVTLNDANFQLAVLDSYAGIYQQVFNYRKKFASLQRQKKQLEDLIQIDNKSKGEREYFKFLYNELVTADLKPGEQLLMETQLQKLTHAEEIKKILIQTTESLSDSESNVISQLSSTINLIQGISRFHPDIQSLVERLKVNYIDIKDISSEISILEGTLQVDSEMIEQLSQRLDIIYKFLKKHQKTSSDELIELKENLSSKISESNSLTDQISQRTQEIKCVEDELIKEAKSISKSRNNILQQFEDEIIKVLINLGISQAQFKIEHISTEALTKDGLDKVRFLFSANRGIELDDVAHIASGGELSRLMLSVKSLISQKNLLPTIFFDEIDNGVSGEIAGKVGAILKKMALKMQVIAITHLPQIAAKGETHYSVYKIDNKDCTTSYIKQLSKHERIEEIAKMLSNEKVTPIALKNAKELINC
ncbi:MAG: DNA repair protein RecN [Bacteroidales bacterium]|nr:DNA repair protein RecN [Bacteroidales bacterium]